MQWIALTRSPGNSYAQALSGAPEPRPIDVEKAQAQHVTYCRTLHQMGVRVVTLPADEHFPDGCFVEDAVVVRRGVAVLTHSGAPSRQGEGKSLRSALRRHGFTIEAIEPPGTLDGGDVLMIEDEAYVGLGSRTNAEGIAQLSDRLGIPAHPVPLPAGMLHLKSGAAYLGDGRLLVAEALLPFAQSLGLQSALVPEEEEPAADALILERQALIPSGYSQTAALLESLGFTVFTVDLSEFAKADGGPTCLSVIWPAPEAH